MKANRRRPHRNVRQDWRASSPREAPPDAASPPPGGSTPPWRCSRPSPSSLLPSRCSPIRNRVRRKPFPCSPSPSGTASGTRRQTPSIRRVANAGSRQSAPGCACRPPCRCRVPTRTPFRTPPARPPAASWVRHFSSGCGRRRS